MGTGPVANPEEIDLVEDGDEGPSGRPDDVDSGDEDKGPDASDAMFQQVSITTSYHFQRPAAGSIPGPPAAVTAANPEEIDLDDL